VHREVEVGEKKYRITIGYGAYQRISALNMFLRVMNPDVEKEVKVEERSPEDIKDATEVATAALKSEHLLTDEGATEIQGLGDIKEGFNLIDLLGAEQKLQEKVNEAKTRILEIAVRDAASNQFLSKDYIEYDLGPVDGEELFNLVIETFELIEGELKDAKRRKKS
jgi:hypothetical protein